MTTTASDLLFDRLIDWGVDTVFGLPGDGINGLMEALRKRQDKIRFIHVRHEEAAAFMACGYAKYTGRLGVCLATSGPGAIHLLNGLYDAALDRAPVLALTGMTYHDLIGTHYQQDVNADYLFENVALFNQRVMGPAHVENLVDLAVRTALANKSVSHITFPNDLQDEDATKQERSPMNVKGHTSDQLLHLSRVPLQADLQRAAAAFRGKQKITILAGNGARHARAALLEKAQAGMREWWKLMEQRGTRTEMPMKPQVVSWNLDQLLADNAIISTDSGTITTWAARQIRIRENQRFSLSGNLATMANGLPYTIAAQLAFPKRQCVAFVGDGGFSMLMAEMSTAVKYELPIKVIVIKNNTLGQIKWEQMVFLGNPEYGVDMLPIDHVKFAESVGARGVRIDDQ